MQQNQPQSSNNQQESENNSSHNKESGTAKSANAATQLVPQQGEIKNNDRQPQASNTSGNNEA